MLEHLVVQRSKEMMAMACAVVLLASCTSEGSPMSTPETAPSTIAPAPLSPYIETCLDQPMPVETIDKYPQGWMAKHTEKQ